jgi:hypothetical protein
MSDGGKIISVEHTLDVIDYIIAQKSNAVGDKITAEDKVESIRCQIISLRKVLALHDDDTPVPKLVSYDPYAEQA